MGEFEASKHNIGRIFIKHETPDAVDFRAADCLRRNDDRMIRGPLSFDLDWRRARVSAVGEHDLRARLRGGDCFCEFVERCYFHRARWLGNSINRERWLCVGGSANGNVCCD